MTPAENVDVDVLGEVVRSISNSFCKSGNGFCKSGNAPHNVGSVQMNCPSEREASRGHRCCDRVYSELRGRELQQLLQLSRTRTCVLQNFLHAFDHQPHICICYSFIIAYFEWYYIVRCFRHLKPEPLRPRTKLVKMNWGWWWSGLR